MDLNYLITLLKTVFHNISLNSKRPQGEQMGVNNSNAITSPKKPNRFLLGILIIITLFFIVGQLGSLFGNSQKSSNPYADLARDNAAECLREKGAGQWQGSMGGTLEQFCDAAGKLAALHQRCLDHPEQC